MTGFGADFKKTRESLGLTLDKIAAETRISTRFLRAIEEGDFRLLPGGIFNRGFIRTYAQHLGLDPEQAIADYERIASAAQQPASPPASVEPVAARTNPRDLYAIAAVVVLLAIAVFYFVNQSSPPEPAPQPAPVADKPAVSAPAPPASPPSPVTEPTPVKPAPPAPEPPPPAVAAKTGEPPIVLELEASNLTWITLTADGNFLEEVILQPGNTRRYEAEASIDIKIGNAAGVMMRVNGRELGVLGREGQTRTFLITPENASRIGA
jgi:cytoskeletal protein RodZ